MTRRGTASLIASPVLVGAVTVLISIIAVFIAYNANSGLPFVPTYDLKAELPSGAKLVKGNEVRAGGFRVGVVEAIRPKTVTGRGGRRAIAEVDLKLDKQVEPLAADTRLEVRPRSALGLKYVQVTPGRGRRTLDSGETIPLRNTSEGLELEDVLSTFQRGTRRDVQEATAGFGDAFAGRGASLNAAIQALRPLFGRLTPVMRNLSDPDTELDRFFLELGRTTGQVAPVADVQARLFTTMADTFEAIGRDPAALKATIERSPPTMEVAIRSFRVQRPFLADFTDLSRRLRPAVRELPRSLPAINSALRVGTRILPDTVSLNRRLRGSLRAIEELVDNPNTLLALRDLKTALRVTRPAIEFIAPYQTVCNFTTYFLTGLAGHFGAIEVPGGTGHAVLASRTNGTQDNRVSVVGAERPADVPSNRDPKTATDPTGEVLTASHTQTLRPAIDAQGNADCQTGQSGYLSGPLLTHGRYPPDSDADGVFIGGGSHVVKDADTPGLAGPTFTGVPRLKDVP
jgi:virulence factor Mce-like protein